MSRTASLLVVCASIALGCGDDNNPVANPHSYELVAPTDEISLRQDSTVALRSLGFVVRRNGTDTVVGANATSLPRLSYFPENVDIAIVDAFGLIRATGPGTTRVRITGYDKELTLTINVRPYKATQAILRVLSRADGGVRATAQRTDTGTFYALPSSAASARLETLVIVDTATATGTLPDTVFCNYCPTKSGAAARIAQRIVTYRSLDPTKLTIANPGDPVTQAGTGTTGIGITALDTSSTPVGVVMEVPSDGLSDTVWLKLALRPIDTLIVSPGSRPVNATFPSQGTVLETYPGDNFSANVARSDLENFDANAQLRSRIFSIASPPRPNGDAGTASFIDVDEDDRPFLPSILWESALDGYLTVNSVGGVVAPCEFIGRTQCVAPTRPSAPGAPPIGGTSQQRTQQARDSLVISCTDNGTGKRLPGLKADGVTPVTSPILFNPPVDLPSSRGILRLANCPPVNGAPGPNIPMPGAFCTTADATDRNSQCTIWFRASVVDPVTQRLIRYYYRINVRLS